MTITPRSPAIGTNRSTAMVAATRSRNNSGIRPGSVNGRVRRRAISSGSAISIQFSSRRSAFQPPRWISCQPTVLPVVGVTEREPSRTADAVAVRHPRPGEDTRRPALGLRHRRDPGGVGSSRQAARPRPPRRAGRTGSSHPAIVLPSHWFLPGPQLVLTAAPRPGAGRSRVAIPGHGARPGGPCSPRAGGPAPCARSDRGSPSANPRRSSSTSRARSSRCPSRSRTENRSSSTASKASTDRRSSTDRAVEQVDGGGALMGEQVGGPVLRPTERRGHLGQRRATPQELGQLGLDAASRPEPLRPARRQVQCAPNCPAVAAPT